MVETEPALLLPQCLGGYDEIIESMGLRFPLVSVTKSFCLHSVLVGVQGQRVRVGLYILLMGSLTVPFNLQCHSGRVSKRLDDAAPLSNVYHGNLLCGQLGPRGREGKEDGHNASIGLGLVFRVSRSSEVSAAESAKTLSSSRDGVAEEIGK